MEQFCSGSGVVSKVRSILKSTSKADLAVAFWGAGGTENLGLRSDQSLRILCDLTSGGCNPYEIEKLLSKKFKRHAEVRSLKGMHAKVYWTPKCVLVGSANASMNGLGEEGSLGNVEAAVATSSISMIKTIGDWFQSQWVGAIPVRDTNDPLMQTARKQWAERPHPRKSKNSLFASAKANRALLTGLNLRVVDYTESSTSEADNFFYGIFSQNYTPAQVASYQRRGELPFYEFFLDERECPVSAGDYIIDCSEELPGLWRVRPSGHIVRIERKGHYIVLLDRVDSVCSFRVPRVERNKLKDYVRMHRRKVRDKHYFLFNKKIAEMPAVFS